MMIVDGGSMFNGRGVHCGEVDIITRTYKTVRDFDRGQVFTVPKYKNAIAVDLAILDELEERGIYKIEVTVINFENVSFKLITNIKTLREKGMLINHDKATEVGVSTYYRDQLAMPMLDWTRIERMQVKKEQSQKVLLGSL
jgi:hypothetical protein